MKEAVIVSAARTPIAKENGALKDVPPEELGGVVIREAVKRANITDPGIIDEVVFGNCFSGVGCIARVSMLKAGLPVTIPAIQVDRQCGSGSTAVNVAAALIQSGAGEVYVAGGVESLTRMPFLLERPSTAYQRAPQRVVGPFGWRLSTEEIGDPPLGIIAENMAERWSVSREDQDEFAFLSQIKAERALKEGRFKEQIVPVTIPQKKGASIVFDTDEHPRLGTTLESLAKLRPAFKPDGTVTAGNSSGINDGAAAFVLASREKALELTDKPLATVKAFASAGVDPNFMGIGPVPATRKVLARTGLTIKDMDVIELNEAFASQAVACCKDLGIEWRVSDRERLSPNGGAIALGHPIAGSLAILVTKAIYELRRIEGRYALITACCGGGQGVATIIERWRD
ncbi:MAG: thiolase family protein [Deltaproteobacteria bacterium]|nr:thiolase family protein [Deltaproteobacteria bacterium]